MSSAIILFAKAPVPGRVKTRLQPAFTSEQAAELHRAFVEDMLDLLEPLSDRAVVQMHTDIATDAWSRPGVSKHLQAPGDLGHRMLAALERALGGGARQAMIVGADVPTLPVAHLEQLLDSEADVALGPTDDGGYYAISCRRTDRAMFEGVEWSSPGTLTATVEAVRRCALSVFLGSAWFDIDSAADLARLRNSGTLPRHTAALLRRYSEPMPIREGDPAPDIELTTDSGDKLRLSDLRGKTVVLYFYPRANTPGCTLESCQFRDAAPHYEASNAVILGVSPDKPPAQSKFRKKYNLPFTLLCDPDHTAAEAFGVWVEKSLFVKKYMGVERSTFVISPEGRIAKVYRKVKPVGHAAEVLAALASN